MLKYLVAVIGFLAVASAQKRAIVTIAGNGTNSVKGVIYFIETSNGLQINGSISGLSPGRHGFHVHATGDLSGGCASLGAHFNPYNKSHGAPNVTERHVGDLGNVVANAAGVAEINFLDKEITLSGANDIIGRGVIVHQDEDDLGLGGFDDSKSTGHAGARVGCGVIGTLSETNGAAGLLAGLSISLSAAIVALLRVM